LLAEGIKYSAVPFATDLPSTNLFTGSYYGIGVLTIPRHGGKPNPVPTSLPTSARLPGAINVGFYDGHAAGAKLDNLWNLQWSKNYVAPARRPGLQ